MKVPTNFNASATKKVDPLAAAINGNFSQNQGSARPQNTPSEPREAVLRDELQESDKNTVLKSNPAPETNTKSQIFNENLPKTENEEAVPQKRREVKEKFLVSMSKGERSVFKAFCAMQNVSMNHFVMCAMDYFKEDLENGKVSLSAHSYKRKEN